MKNCHQNIHFNSNWQNELANAYTDPLVLLHYLQLHEKHLPYRIAKSADFPMRVPQSYADRMEKGNPYDPLLLQTLPLISEQLEVEGYVADPVGDLEAIVSPGMLHKYHNRVLLISTGACAIHCRYCFRRNFPYSDSILTRSHWEDYNDHLKSHPEINEVILSGGDPLVLSDTRLQAIYNNLDNFKQIKIIRIHTRVPVVLPKRVDSHFLKAIKQSHKQFVLVLHCNHANEINHQVVDAISSLRDHNIILLNQSVLLKGINDSVEALAELSEKLTFAGVLPYYLHMLDPVQGAAHFAVSEHRAKDIMTTLRSKISGYMLPRLVREIAGKSSKIPV